MRVKWDKFETKRFGRLIAILVGLSGLMVAVGWNMGRICS